MRYRLWIILILAAELQISVPAFDPASVAPSDAFLFIFLSDAPFLKIAGDSGYYSQFYDAEKHFRVPDGIQEHLKNWARDFPVTYDEWIRMFPGSQCCYLSNLDLHSGNSPVFDSVLILEHNGDLEEVKGFIEKHLVRISPDAKKSSYLHNGIKVFVEEHYYRKRERIQTPLPLKSEKTSSNASSPSTLQEEVFREFSYHFQYAFMDRYVFFCEGKGEPIKALIDRCKTKGALTLSGNGTYRILFEDISGQRSMKLYINLEDFFSKLADWNKMEKKFDPSPLLLTELKAAGIAWYLSPHGLQSQLRLYAPAPRKGICDAAYHFRENRFSSLRFAPPDMAAFTSVSLDLFMVYRSLLTALSSLYPQEIASFRQTILSNNVLIGVNLEDQILKQIKGELGYYLRKRSGSTGGAGIVEVYFIEVENPALFLESLKKLFIFAKNNLALEMGEKKHLDIPYWIPAPIGGNIKQDDYIPSFGIFMHDRYLFVSRDVPELLSLIERMKSGNQNSFPREDIKAFMNRYPGNDCVGMRIADRKVSPAILNGLQSLLEGKDREKPERSLFDSHEKASEGEPLKILIYQNQDVISIISEMPFSTVETNIPDP